ncbi:MAG: dipeptidase [Desulfotomaculaceae bacterium]|nr:dipeptidase [Desulfotomaculaceae bacterium]
MAYLLNNRAAELHRQSVVVDAHCDTLTVLLEQNRRLGQLAGHGHLDLPRLKMGGVKVQFFAAFISPEFKYAPLKRVLELIDNFLLEIAENPKDVHHVKNLDDIYQACHTGKVAALLTVEGGECLEGSTGVLRQLYTLGVRGLTLTWNNRNELGNGVKAREINGLTTFGLTVVEELNRLGALIDVSHLSEEGYWDVLQYSRQPVIASHSNCKALCNHPRNLSDEQIRALAENGGVMGITFVPDFLGGEKPSLKEVLNHIDHAVAVGGVDCVGLGSDFDGTEKLALGLEDCSLWPTITGHLIDRGYRDGEVEKIIGGNFLRVIGQVLK